MLQPGLEIANRTIAVAAYADLLWPCRASFARCRTPPALAHVLTFFLDTFFFGTFTWADLTVGIVALPHCRIFECRLLCFTRRLCLLHVFSAFSLELCYQSRNNIAILGDCFVESGARHIERIKMLRLPQPSAKA